MLKLFTAAALAAAALTAGAAQAQAPADSADTYSVAVRSADLNLASASGVATFRGRVRAAAAHACGDAKVSPLLEASTGSTTTGTFGYEVRPSATACTASAETSAPT